MTLQVLLGHVADGLNRGERYYVPIKHTVITGMTEYGKTTAEEAMMYRLPEDQHFRCLVFLTKRGEKTFQGANRVQPFFRERFDWEYVRGLLESAMKERLKFETPWIIRVCKLAQAELKGQKVDPGEGLGMVRKLLGNMLQREKLRDFDRNIYTLLAAYMDKVLPVIAQAKFVIIDTLTLNPGINVMDLMPWYTHEEFQMLVIRSCMEQILERESNVIVGLPEAWKLLPQGRNTPVKLYFEKYIREGATNKNYLWIDAQDLGGVDKTPLRQVDVWIMGHMLEANEVSRLLEQTLGAKMDPSVIQTLPLGHFLVATGEKVTKVYVWPNGIPEDMSVSVAKGVLKPESVKELLVARQMPKTTEPFEVTTYISGLERQVDALSRRVDTVTKDLNDLVKVVGELPQIIRDHIDDPVLHASAYLKGNATGPGSLTLEHKELAITVAHAGPEHVKLSTTSIPGKILYCMIHLSKQPGYNVEVGSTAKEIDQCLGEHGWGVRATSLSAKLSLLSNDGHLVKTEKGYRLPKFVLFDVQREREVS